MKDDLTLLIPAKNEKESIGKVINELKKYNYKSLIILNKNDISTINAINNIKNRNTKIIFQIGKGYGNALKYGIKNCKTKYFCIFNADGSFNPEEIYYMKKKIQISNGDFVFASRYEKFCSSDDDTIVTKLGNFFFTKLGQLLFRLKITDILYTYVLGKTLSAKKLGLNSNNFGFCVELPILAKFRKMKLLTSKSHERVRIGGKKKVNELRDGTLILIKMLQLYKNKK